MSRNVKSGDPFRLCVTSFLRGRAALFGSVARGEARPDSDIDVLVELDPERSTDLLAYVGIVQFVEDLFPLPVDVADRAGLNALVRSSVEYDPASPL